MSISKKLIVLVICTVVVLVTALGLLGYFIISSSGNESAQKALSVAQKTMQANIDTKLAEYSVYAQMLEHDSDLAEAAAERNPDSLKAMARRIAGIPGIDQFTVCDMQGTVLVRGHSDKAGDTVSLDRLMLATPLKEGKRIVGLEPGALIRLSLGAGIPVRQDGRQVGVAIIGTDLSSGAFVNSLKAVFGVESTIFYGDERISTTVMRDGKPVINTKLNNEAIFDKVIRQGESVVTQNIIAGGNYDTIYWPWKDLSGKNAGIFFVGLPRADIAAAQNQIVFFFLLAGAGLGLGLIVIGTIIARAISKPLQQATAYAERVAEGDFSGQLTVATKDEVGVLAKALGVMVKNLEAKIGEADERSREAALQAEKAASAMTEAEAAKNKAEEGQKAILKAAEQVEQVVAHLSTAANNLNGQIASASQGVEGQREQVASCATAMEEMNSTVLEVARSASYAAEASANTKTKAESGSSVVNECVGAIERVREEVGALRTLMGDLGREAEGIGAVVTVINDIADQTNLLALNAAIEAARAGEAGRGFAVVADEVRKLAEKTMTATKEVSDVVRSIQNGTLKSMESVDRTGMNIGTAVDMVNKSGEALSEIVGESVASADQVHGIATAAEEQSATSAEISKALSEINSSAEVSAGSMRLSVSTVSDVTNQVHELQQLVLQLRKQD